MNILFLSDVYFPRVNGVSTSIATFRTDLQALGHRVDLAVPAYPCAGDGKVVEHGITRLPSRRVPLDPEDRLMQWSALMATLPQLRERRYDVLHVHTPFVAHYAGVRFARALGIPCVETYHTFFEAYLQHYVPLLPASWLRLLARRLSRSQGNQTDGMVVPSRATQDVLWQYGVNAPLTILPTGLAPECFAAADGAAFRMRHGLDPKRPLLLCVGRTAFEKNMSFLLRVMRQLRAQVPDALLLIAGEGPARAALEREAASLDLHNHVRFLGYLDRATELNACYRCADVFVFASRTETQGLVLLEAMAQGTPVVSVAELGTWDVLREGCGARIAREEEADFVAKLLPLLLDRSNRDALGTRARQWAEQWSSRTQARRLIEFYEGVLGARSAR